MDYIFFDFNGTLVDDVELCLYLLNEMLKQCHHKEVSKEKYLDIFTFPVKEYYEKAGFDFSKDDFVHLANFFIEEYQKRNIFCKLYDDVLEVLDSLKKHGKHLIILSASEIGMLEKQLKDYLIFPYFEKILGKNDIYATGKSEMGLKFIKEAKMDPSSCVLIGDTLHDEETAKAMGISSILVARGHQSLTVLKRGNSRIVSTLKDILPLL